MLSSEPIVILDGGRRTPRADILEGNRSPGLFTNYSTTHLGGKAIRETLAATELDDELVGHVVMGMAMQSHRDSIYGAQGMRWRSGLGDDVPALTVARICGSGAEAVCIGSEIILSGLRHDRERPFVVVGGAESMQYPFCAWGLRGRKVGSAVQKYGPVDPHRLDRSERLQDMLLLSLYDPGSKMTMANTAEELGRRYQITREEADEFGLSSHHKARAARDEGHFDEEIAPVRVRVDAARDAIDVLHDTHILDDASLSGMASLRPAFEAGGIITAGNASAVVDGAAAMVIAKEADADAASAPKLARIIGMGVAACDPQIMGWGPVPATRKALEMAGIGGQDLDHIEINEAFAPQALACIRDFAEMGIDPEKVNPMGNAIAMGHPLGATGAILTLTCAYALRRKGERYGLVTMCIGGGQGVALILESAAA